MHTHIYVCIHIYVRTLTRIHIHPHPHAPPHTHAPNHPARLTRPVLLAGRVHPPPLGRLLGPPWGGEGADRRRSQCQHQEQGAVAGAWRVCGWRLGACDAGAHALGQRGGCGDAINRPCVGHVPVYIRQMCRYISIYCIYIMLYIYT